MKKTLKTKPTTNTTVADAIYTFLKNGNCGNENYIARQVGTSPDGVRSHISALRKIHGFNTILSVKVPGERKVVYQHANPNVDFVSPPLSLSLVFNNRIHKYVLVDHG